MTSSGVVVVFVLSLISLFSNLAFSKTTSQACNSMKFTNNKTFDNCINLPTLSAILHYSYDSTKSTLSMAFTATPSSVNGWVSWALNPKDTGMEGAQALVAYKDNKSGSILLKTWDMVGMDNIIEGNISYNVTAMSAEESANHITILATWVIPGGENFVNQVWQMGPVLNGKPSMHESKPENLNSCMKLNLVNGSVGAPTDSHVKAPTKSPSAPGGDDKTHASPPPEKAGGARKGVVSIVMILGALVGFIL